MEDRFKTIAMTRHPSETRDIEIKPMDHKVQDLPQVDKRLQRQIEARFNEKPKDLSYEDKCQSFYKDLDDLRQTYKPFMEDHLPLVEETVRAKALKRFEFRYKNRGDQIQTLEEDSIRWESIQVPDYRGPAEEKGRWHSYYRSSFDRPWDKDDEQRIILYFQCVDYKANVYINKEYVGSHEGFFGSFEWDITDFLEETNELIVECINDIPILGVGPVLDGDKIYAATGPGWDDPQSGWHHCPAGGGIFGKVLLERRPKVHVKDIFVQAKLLTKEVEVRIGIINYTEKVLENYRCTINLNPKNFKGDAIGGLTKDIAYIGIGENEYRYRIDIDTYRLWSCEKPFLYGADVFLSKEEECISFKRQTFGLKTFISDLTSSPKGRFRMNGKPIVLRGANEMGHLQQCVMQENWKQLVDDLLIAKLCHMNYYRMTQRPVQEEIYDYMDMLGMMHQCDFPLFGFLRRNQFSEALRQVGEMEYLVRGHVSTVMVSLINEPMCIRPGESDEDKFSKRYEAKGHRHLFRDELEAFFSAARKAIYVLNPERVIKNVEGDYDGPTQEGMPDFHTYTMWYTNHGQAIGKLLKGYLPPVKKGWMVGCGEYGAEGLDHEKLMLRSYPKSWLEKDEKGHWYPDRIVKAQTFGVHGDWFREQTTISDWVRESQKHQAKAVSWMTDAFRRRADIMNQTAIHLLIDAWPSGWMKALVSQDRCPKPAYFAYQRSLKPMRLCLFSQRKELYDDEVLEIEVWLLNDTNQSHQVAINIANVIENKSGDRSIDEVYRKKTGIEAVSSLFVGCIHLHPSEESKGLLSQSQEISGFVEEEDKVVDWESLKIRRYPRRKSKEPLIVIGEEAKEIATCLKQNPEGLEFTSNSDHDYEGTPCLLTSDTTRSGLMHVQEKLNQGERVVLLLPPKEDIYNLGQISIKTHACTKVFFGACQGNDEESRHSPFDMCYNNRSKCIDSVGGFWFETSMPGQELVYTYGRSTGENRPKPHLPFMAKYKMGKGELILVSLFLKGRIGYNPRMDNFIWKQLLDESTRDLKHMEIEEEIESGV